MNDFEICGYDTKRNGGFKTVVIGLLCVLIVLCSILIGKANLGGGEKTVINYVDADGTSLADLYESVREGVVVINCTTSDSAKFGSGFIVSAEGYIITNYHVISSTTSVEVELVDGSTFPAVIVGFDSENDIALLKIETTKKLHVLTIGDASKSRTGDKVFVIGIAVSTDLFGSLTTGIISYNNRKINGEDTVYIQTDASINPGNSGGPVFNMKGEVIGVSQSKIATDKVDNICFAISSVTFKPILDELIALKPISKIGLGITGAAVKDTSYSGTWPDGVYVVSITGGGPADLAGVKIGDIITYLDGVKVSSVEDIRAILDIHKDKDVVSMVVIHEDDSEETLSVTLRSIDFYE